MNIIALIDLVNVFIAVYLGTLVYSKDPGNRLNRLFLLNSLLSAYCALLEYLRFTAQSVPLAFIWHKGSFLWPFFPVVFLMYVMTLTGSRLGANKAFKYFFMIPAFLISFMHLFTDSLYSGLVQEWYGWNFTIAKNIYSASVPVHTLSAGIMSIVLIIKHYIRLKDDRKRKQVIFTFIGVTIPYVTGFVSQVLFPMLGLGIPPLNASSYLMGTVFLSISLLKYKFFIPDPLGTVRQVFAAIEDYLIIYNQKQEIILASKSFYDCTLYSEDEVIGQKLECFLQSSTSQNSHEILSWHFGKEVELTLKTANARKIPISGVISTLYNKEEKKPLYLLIGRNLMERKQFEKELLLMHQELEDKIKLRTVELQNEIVERKNIELALRVSEKRFRHLFENSPIGIYQTTSDGKVLVANPALINMLGYSSLEELQKVDLEAYGFPDKTARANYSAIINEKGALTGYESTWVKQDGTFICCRENAIALRDEKGEVICIEGTVENITEQKLAEQALRKSEERYKMLINTANEGIVVIDENNVIVFVNSRMSELLGYLPDEIEGKSPMQFIFNEDLADHLKKVESRIQGVSSSYERRYERKDGRILWTITSVAPIADEKGSYLGAIAMITDITARKKAEKEIEKYWLSLEDQVKERTLELEVVNRLLQDEIIKQKETEVRIKEALAKEHELNTLKSRFISTTSHEFRTPLTTVLSSIELLERYGRNWDTENYFKQIGRIKKSVKNLTHLMDDVLLISRAETGKIKFEPKVLDLHKICLNIIDDIKSLLTEKHHINFEYNLLSYDYYLDENLLKLTLSNLLSNAIKYSVKGGEIDFIVSSCERDIVLEIRDEGIGIPEEDQANLFEPFNRGKNVGNIHGTGLGMSIVKKAIDIHEGTISVESRAGKGTKVTVQIPIR